MGRLRKQDEIAARVLNEANYFIEEESTVRATAEAFGVSKSTTHKDLTERLTIFYPYLIFAVSERLSINKEERHIRGGMATKEKYLNKHIE